MELGLLKTNNRGALFNYKLSYHVMSCARIEVAHAPANNVVEPHGTH
jgi:hypothetical protein